MSVRPASLGSARTSPMGRALRTHPEVRSLNHESNHQVAPPALRAFTAQTVLDSLQDAVPPLGPSAG